MDQFIGQISLAAFPFAPRGWAFCNGQLMAINQNQPLFALIGVTYGGDGVQTFALPDLRGRIPVSSSGTLPLGTITGSETVTLLAAQIPTHTHTVTVSSLSAGTPATPIGNTLEAGSVGNTPYSATANDVMAQSAISTVGSGQGHENRAPFTVLNYIISLTGIFPSRN